MASCKLWPGVRGVILAGRTCPIFVPWFLLGMEAIVCYSEVQVSKKMLEAANDVSRQTFTAHLSEQA